MPGPFSASGPPERSICTTFHEWAEGRRYLGLDILAKSRLNIVSTSDTTIDKEDLPALSA